MKDLPTRMPPGIVLAGVPAREDPRDGFIALQGARPGGAAGRRGGRHRQPAPPGADAASRPDLKVELLRGRVETRLAKIESGAFDATYLALAGLTRLGLEQHVAVDGRCRGDAAGAGPGRAGDHGAGG